MEAKAGFHGQHPRCLPSWFPVTGPRLIFHGRVFRGSSIFCPSAVRSGTHRGSVIDRSSHFPHSAYSILYETAGSVAKMAGPLVSRPGTGSGRDPAPRSPGAQGCHDDPRLLGPGGDQNGGGLRGGSMGIYTTMRMTGFSAGPAGRERDRRPEGVVRICGIPPFWREGVSIVRSAPRGDSKTPRRVQTGVFSLKGTIG
jgi:hypothetical protein